MKARRSATAVAVTALTALALAACGGGGDAETSSTDDTTAEEIPADEFDEAMNTPTELTFWTWVPDIQQQVDMFMEEYPEISVEVVNVGQGATHYQQLRTAIEAGSGAPDVVHMEFQLLPSFLIGGELLDLSPYVGDIADLYPDWVWSQVSQNGSLWAIPQDTGPMGHLYREDLLAEAGVELPQTWDEYADAARAYREANPDSYITNMPGNDPGEFVGLFWQAGAEPFGYDGQETVTIDLTSPEVMQVVEYWNELIAEDLVATDPDFTDQWYQGLANGKYAGWLTAAWGPMFLQGTAGDTAGLWRAAELPQWSASESTAGNWGGSTNAVLRSTESPVAAAELARWINVEREPTMNFALEQFLFPASIEVLESEEFQSEESEFYGGQQVNALFADISTTIPTSFGWLPFMEYAYGSFNETLGAALNDRTDLVAGLEAWEEDLIAYAEAQGFTVE